MTKLGMGVVGVGTMGKRHAENIRRLIPEAQLRLAFDRAWREFHAAPGRLRRSLKSSIPTTRLKRWSSEKIFRRWPS